MVFFFPKWKLNYLWKNDVWLPPIFFLDTRALSKFFFLHIVLNRAKIHTYNSGLEINKKMLAHFTTICENLLSILQILVAKSPCVVSGLAKKYEPAIHVCKETAENGEWLKEWT